MSNPDSQNANDPEKKTGGTWMGKVIAFLLGFVTGSATTIGVGLASGAVEPEDVGISKDSTLGEALGKKAA